MNELQQLKDIHLPQPISMWPIAPGWISLYVLLMVMMVYGFYCWYQTRKRKAVVRLALAKLENLQQLMMDNPDKINIAAEISTLLRRTALYYFRREDIAALSGKPWLEFLDRSGNTNHFTETGDLLTDAPYQKEINTNITPLFALAKTWLMAISKKNVTLAEK